MGSLLFCSSPVASLSPWGSQTLCLFPRLTVRPCAAHLPRPRRVPCNFNRAWCTAGAWSRLHESMSDSALIVALSLTLKTLVVSFRFHLLSFLPFFSFPSLLFPFYLFGSRILCAVAGLGGETVALRVPERALPPRLCSWLPRSPVLVQPRAFCRQQQ